MTEPNKLTDAELRERMRYCMNSASLRFVPVEQLEAEGDGQFLPLFAEKH